MKLEFLKYFVVLADELHFARAAEKVSITQPALSSAIKSLEADVGVRLFERSRTMVRLTPAGAAFLAEAHQFLEGYSRARALARAVSGGLAGRLDIGFAVTLVYRDILRAVQRFAREAPAIDVTLLEMSNAAQFEALMRGRLHAGFVVGPSVPPPLESMLLRNDRFAVCLPDSHPKAAAKTVSLRELADEAFIMVTRAAGPSTYDDIVSSFNRAGIAPKVAHYTLNWMSVMTLVGHGCGVGLVPSSLIHARTPGIRIVPMSGLPAYVSAMMVWNPANVLPALDKLIDVARRTIGAR